MAVKDYYKILEVKPSAREDEIKKSFRRLALQYHPDVNNGEKHADAWYREIQEAYEVLTDPNKKSNYLQERWLLKSKGLPFEDTTPLTPAFIELKFRSLRQSVAYMDHYRMSQDQLKLEILAICCDQNLDALLTEPDESINGKILQHIIFCVSPLDFKYLNLFLPILNRIAGTSRNNQETVKDWYKNRKQSYYWEKNQWWIFLLITLMACFIIFFLTR